MKKSTMLATAAFAVLLGLFVPCTSHATEIKDTDPTTVQWDKATRKECTNSEGVSYVDYTFPEDQTQSYNSYDDAVTSLAKFTVDAVADHKSNFAYDTDILANANGYEFLALQILKKQGAA